MPLRGLLIAQFFGAFNDNAWKLIVALLGMRAAGARVGFSGPAYEAAAQLETTLAFVVFTLPLMLVSFPAGVLADRISKRSVIVLLKGLEVALMAAATLVLISDPLGGVPALVLLGLMGAHGALFSPAKYGILPEILPHHLLSAGNGLLEMWSFAAIIAGTVAGGLILGQAGEGTWKVGAVLTAFSVLGFIASLSVPRVPPSRSEGGLASWDSPWPGRPSSGPSPASSGRTCWCTARRSSGSPTGCPGPPWPFRRWGPGWERSSPGGCRHRRSSTACSPSEPSGSHFSPYCSEVWLPGSAEQ